jgi:hypothetical protein
MIPLSRIFAQQKVALTKDRRAQEKVETLRVPALPGRLKVAQHEVLGNRNKHV